MVLVLGEWTRCQVAQQAQFFSLEERVTSQWKNNCKEHHDIHVYRQENGKCKCMAEQEKQTEQQGLKWAKAHKTSKRDITKCIPFSNVAHRQWAVCPVQQHSIICNRKYGKQGILLHNNDSSSKYTGRKWQNITGQSEC